MSETREVIFYRHEHTKRTIAQARAHGLLSDGDRVTVVARDSVTHRGDVPVHRLEVYPGDVRHVIVVINGWDTFSLAMVLPRLAKCDGSDRLDLNVYAVDEDGAVRLY
jgi:hypothetical protein